MREAFEAFAEMASSYGAGPVRQRQDLSSYQSLSTLFCTCDCIFSVRLWSINDQKMLVIIATMDVVKVLHVAYLGHGHYGLS